MKIKAPGSSTQHPTNTTIAKYYVLITKFIMSQPPNTLY